MSEKLTVAELLARSGRTASSGSNRPRRRRSLEDGGVSVAELTGSIPVVKDVDSDEEGVVDAEQVASQPEEPKPERTKPEVPRTPPAEARTAAPKPEKPRSVAPEAEKTRTPAPAPERARTAAPERPRSAAPAPERSRPAAQEPPAQRAEKPASQQRKPQSTDSSAWGYGARPADRTASQPGRGAAPGRESADSEAATASFAKPKVSRPASAAPGTEQRGAPQPGGDRRGAAKRPQRPRPNAEVQQKPANTQIVDRTAKSSERPEEKTSQMPPVGAAAATAAAAPHTTRADEPTRERPRAATRGGKPAARPDAREEQAWDGVASEREDEYDDFQQDHDAPEGDVSDGEVIEYEDDTISWPAMIGQTILAIAIGIGVFLGFNIIWAKLPTVVVLVLALAVTLLMVGVVHALLRHRDKMIMLLTFVVGLVITLGPRLIMGI